MDINKRIAFNQRMGIRQKLARGGMVRRKHFDSGGTVPGTSPGNGSLTVSASTPFSPQMAQGIASAFTPQNQFVAQTAPTDYTNYQNAIAAGGNNALAGYANYQNYAAQQQALANQLQGVANGTGPNPAQTMLNQATGQNVANQAALAASQRGAAGNVGLLARQAATQGAAAQQQAAGQAATMQAQQQLNALGAIGQQQQNLQAANVAEQGQNANLYNISAGAQNQQNANTIANWNNAQTINAATAQNNTNAVGSTESGLLGGAASVVSSLFAKGGEVGDEDQSKSYFSASPSNGRNISVEPPQGTFSGAMSSLTNMIPGGSSTPSPMQSTPMGGAVAGPNGSISPGAGGMGGVTGQSYNLNPNVQYAAQGGRVCPGPHKSHVANFLMSKGGKVPAMVSPGEVYLSPDKVDRVLNGEDPLKIGEKISGKAKVKGNSTKNDTVPKTLDEGGVVISRTHTKNPESAELFVRRAVHMKKAGK